MMGWIGSALLSICAIPLAVDALKGRVVQLNRGFYWCWFGGEVALAISYWQEPALLMNYSVNIICLIIVGIKK